MADFRPESPDIPDIPANASFTAKYGRAKK